MDDELFRVNVTKNLTTTGAPENFEYSQSMHLPPSPGKLLPD
jgi:hypothetical protein